MSYKKGIIYPANPNTARGAATRIDASKDKIAYSSGRTIIIRDINKLNDVIVYAGHIHPTTVARISPTGYYCASADTAGNVRIWDTVGEENILKKEVKPFFGKINDLAWDGESKRIIAVGEGREKTGHAFNFDTGTSVGEIGGHGKPPNAVSTRHQRPFRAVTCADDRTIVLHQGVPYKYYKTINTHTRFVQDIRYAPSGDVFVSVGSDYKVFLYDGNEGETIADLTDNPHTGTIYAAAWSPDSRNFITSSADRTVKLWDSTAQKAVTTWTVGSSIGDQQVGNAWAGDEGIVSLSLDGNLNIFDRRSGQGPARILSGPNKSVTASTVSPVSGTFFAGSYEGRVLSLSAEAGIIGIDGKGHTNQISGLVAADDQSIFSVAYDDQVKQIGANGFSDISLPTLGQPKGIAAGGSYVFVATVNGLNVVKDGKIIKEQKLDISPLSIAVSTDATVIAIGAEDNKVYLYTWTSEELKPTGKTLENSRGMVTALAISKNGNYLAAGDSAGKIILYERQEGSNWVVKTKRWDSHAARINSLKFHPNSLYAVSGSLDTNVYIWSVEQPTKKIPILNAGMGGVNVVEWLSNTLVVSAGADASFRTWEVQLIA